jgi:outer membrane protein OmpA-like peptidoglycan-associated protein
MARADGVDMSPLPYYRDSPVLVKDKVTEGYMRTSAKRPGEKADPDYLERIATATVINEATLLYNAEKYQEALGQYRSALATPAGEQMRVVNGIYLTNVKLGRVVALGIAYNELGVKFLFNPGGTDFWSDTKVSGTYGMWLRQIAKVSTDTKVCMDIVGHTSKTGPESVNDALSLRRATYVKQRLGAEAAELANRTRSQGMGFRQNIVGSGTDDAVDALDRRVEFRIVPCG